MELVKLARRSAFTYAAALIVSCAHRVPSTGAAAAAAPRPGPITTTARVPAKTTAAVPSPPERRATLQSRVPRTEPTRAEQIIILVREGYLVGESKGALVFSKARAAKVLATGLYEDAILLGRLRRALKDADGIPDSVFATVTVRDAKAFLSLEETVPASTAARAIDAALRTPGINSVQVRIAG